MTYDCLGKQAAAGALAALLLIPSTYSSYVDSAKISSNSFAAASIDIELQTMEGDVLNTALFDVTLMIPDDEAEQSLRVADAGTIGPKYQAEIEIGDSPTLCEALDIEVTRDDMTVFTGKVSAFATTAEMMSGGADDWNFKISLHDDSELLQNIECSLDLVFTARQPELPLSGYADNEEASGSVMTGSWIEPRTISVMSLVQSGTDVFNDFFVPVDLGSDPADEDTGESEDGGMNEDEEEDGEVSPAPEETDELEQTPEVTPTADEPQENEELSMDEDEGSDDETEDFANEDDEEDTSEPRSAPVM